MTHEVSVIWGQNFDVEGYKIITICSMDIKCSAYFANRHELEFSFIYCKNSKRKNRKHSFVLLIVCTALPDFILTNTMGALTKLSWCSRMTFEFIPLKNKKIREKRVFALHYNHHSLKDPQAEVSDCNCYLLITLY